MAALRDFFSRTAGFLRSAKASGQMRNVLTFLVFVAIALLFWLIMALNDNVQDSFDVNFKVTDVPSTVTFITEPPAKIHVTVRDRGTTLLRLGHLQHPSVSVDFRNFCADGRFRFTRSDLLAALRQTFGATASISSISVDSISVPYTTNPGRRVPVKAEYHVSAASGKIVMPNPALGTRTVLVYGPREVTDTIHVLPTERISLSNLEDTRVVDARIKEIPGVRIIPDHVKVTFQVEPLVKKESLVAVSADNIPSDRDLLFFPARVRVVYYVPMSRFNTDDDGIVVKASYQEALYTHSERVGLKITYAPTYVRNVSLPVDSVEYTIVRGQ